MTETGSALLSFDLDDRRRLVTPGGAWASLATALAAELVPLQQATSLVPEVKARLTRIGGRCARDGILLEFDPWSPHVHRCPQCGATYTEREHHEWWAMGAKLWSAERAVHAAALFLLRLDVAHAKLAERILEQSAALYHTWPNRDNVLGPSRPFFSTYLESIWLLNLCQAIALLERAPRDSARARVLDRVRDTLVEPSAALIATYHEGLSNRQAWNEAALLGAYRILGKTASFEQRATESSGVMRLLDEGLLADGTWYEGENYHLFAHRGLWYAVESMRANGIAVGDARLDKYSEGFATPFLGVLPDDTFPSRRDSQYRVSIRQWRFAEWCELGVANRADARLSGVLSRLYDESVPRRSTGRDRSTADAERNTPPSSLSRADCSWRTLLMGREQLPEAKSWKPASVLLASQGLAIIRREAGQVYAALEGGHTGGGHGHPDRLALTLQRNSVRWLEDPGAGSYVDPTLHWYRSTLAHHAPLIDRRSQPAVSAQLFAYEDRGAAGWVVKRMVDPRSNTTVERTIVVCDGYLVDLLEWNSADPHEITLPICGEADDRGAMAWRNDESSDDRDGGATEPRVVDGGNEDGFDFVANAEVAAVRDVVLDVPGHVPQTLDGVARQRNHHEASSRMATLRCVGSSDLELVRARVPGPPGTGTMQRHWLRTRSARGQIASCWSWASSATNEVVGVDVESLDPPVIRVRTADGSTAIHSRVEHGWHIELLAGNARSSIDLEGLRSADLVEPGVVQDERHADLSAPPTSLPVIRIATAPRTSVQDENDLADLLTHAGIDMPGALQWELGERHYIRTEQSWRDADAPTARVQLGIFGEHLIVDVVARTGSVVVPPDGARNALDNERADVNADGLQLYVGTEKGEEWSSALLLVPAGDQWHVTPRVSFLTSHVAPALQSSARITSNGWAARLALPLADLPSQGRSFVLDLVVNERPPDRERRRGQLVLSGGGAGGFGYLRGDRHSSSYALAFTVPPIGNARGPSID